MDPLTKTAGLMDFAVKLKSESILLHFIWLRVAHFRTKSNGQSVLIISDKQSSLPKPLVNDPAHAGYVTGEIHEPWAYMNLREVQPLIDVKLLLKYQKYMLPVAMYLDHGCGGLSEAPQL